MSCNCSNSGCTDGSKCVPNKYTSEMIYDGLASTCPELADIKPNCTNLSDVIKILADQLCFALSGANNGKDGASYKATSVTALALDGLFTSRVTAIIPILAGASLGTAYNIGCRVRFASLANPTVDYFEGVVTAFDNSTGALTFLVDHFGPTASGNHSDWQVSLAGDVGQTGGGAPSPVYVVESQPVQQSGPQIDVTWPGSSYTVPIGGDGNYDIHLQGFSQIDGLAGNDLYNQVRIYKNGFLTLLPAYINHRQINGTQKEIVPYHIAALNIALVAGDVITLNIYVQTPSSVINANAYHIIKRS